MFIAGVHLPPTANHLLLCLLQGFIYPLQLIICNCVYRRVHLPPSNHYLSLCYSSTPYRSISVIVFISGVHLPLQIITWNFVYFRGLPAPSRSSSPAWPQSSSLTSTSPFRNIIVKHSSEMWLSFRYLINETKTNLWLWYLVCIAINLSSYKF